MGGVGNNTSITEKASDASRIPPEETNVFHLSRLYGQNHSNIFRGVYFS
jgi:hypothetical protein